jgi:hypothetical protein
MNRNLIGVGGIHVVPLVNPASISNAKVTSDNVKMDNIRHALFLISFGTFTADLDADITVIASTNAAGNANETVLGTIKFRKMVATDTWSALTEVADSKLDLVAAGDIALTAGTRLAIEIEAQDLKDLSDTVDLNWVRFEISAGGAYAYTVSADAILWGQRFSQNVPVSAIA